MTRAFEHRLRDELCRAHPPGAGEAERRAWRVVRAAHAARAPVGRRSRVTRLALAAAAALVAAAVALSPAGARMGDWISDVVDSEPASLSSLPAAGRLLVVADGGVWIVGDDGARRQLRGFSDATWSPGGLFIAAARGDELVALDPRGTERWTRPASGLVSVPRWSPDGYRVAYRSGADLRVVFGDNAEDWLLDRSVGPAAPAWKPLPAPALQVLAFAVSRRVRIVEVDTRRELGRTPPGPEPREIWWARDGQRLVTVTAGSVRVHGARGRLLRTVELPRGLEAVGSAMAPGGRSLAVLAERVGTDRPEGQLLIVRLDRAARPRTLLSMPGSFEGLTWSIDGSVLVAGRPGADQWLYVRPRGSARLQSVEDVRNRFAGGASPRTGAFPRPAGWCYAEPANRTARGQPPCSSGASP